MRDTICCAKQVLRLLARRPALAAFHKGSGRTFPLCIHGDEGTGLCEVSTLLLTWSIGWRVLSDDGTVSTWRLRFPFGVLPHSRAIPGVSIPAFLQIFVDRP